MAGEYERHVHAVHADPDADHRAPAMAVIAEAARHISPGDAAAADAMCAPLLAGWYAAATPGPSRPRGRRA